MIIQALESAHRMMEHVLTLIRVQVDILHPETGPEQYAFLRRAIGYMHNYPGLIHHPAEELIFDRLTQYAPQARPLCDRLVDEHKMFVRQETAIFGHIANAEQGDGASCKRIMELGADYCMKHVGHISDEESKVLPQAVNWLSPGDWRKIHEQCRFEHDPLGKPAVLAAYESIYDYLMAESVSFNRH